MITKASECPTDRLQYIANFVCENGNFFKENFPLCSNALEVTNALASSDSWYILVAKRPISLFKLEISEARSSISRICVNGEDSLEAFVSNLRHDLHNMRITDVIVSVAPNDVELLETLGFTARDSYVRFSRVPTEIKMMPILPLMNATQKVFPNLSRLMYEAYDKTEHGFSDLQSAEKSLRAITSGAQGQYLSDASFASGVLPNLVSGCLVVSDSPGEARITQVFTHPLYRARGLATTEIAAAMNRLVVSGTEKLIAWNRVRNDLVRRLLTKMEFKEDRRVVEMAAKI
jgi:GNAT superfamily N-acetyltransferase